MTDQTAAPGNPGQYSNPDVTPPLASAIPLGIQHVLAMFASNVTPSIIVAGAAGLAFGSADQVYLIQMARFSKNCHLFPGQQGIMKIPE